jgi:hypothetical protein
MIAISIAEQKKDGRGSQSNRYSIETGQMEVTVSVKAAAATPMET